MTKNVLGVFEVCIGWFNLYYIVNVLKKACILIFIATGISINRVLNSVHRIILPEILVI